MQLSTTNVTSRHLLLLPQKCYKNQDEHSYVLLAYTYVNRTPYCYDAIVTMHCPKLFTSMIIMMSIHTLAMACHIYQQTILDFFG